MLHYAIFALVALLVVLAIILNFFEQASIHGLRRVAVEFCAGLCLAILLGSLAAACI